MKLAAYGTKDGHRSWGALLGENIVDGVDLCSERLNTHIPTINAALRSGILESVRSILDDPDTPRPTRSAAEIDFRAPLGDPTKIVAIGRNYRDHAAEADLKLPKWPKIFPKFNSAIIGPGASVVKPTITSQLDFEVEVGVVIGRTAHHIAESEAMDFVAGYTIINDISARDLQFADEQVTLGKNFDTFCPMGPVLTTADELPDPNDIHLSLRLNGQTMQSASTAMLIFTIPYLVSFLSYVMTLEPGDVISTGTPSGVGCFRSPPVWLKGGDLLESTVEGVGTLRNPVEEAAGPVPPRVASQSIRQ